MSARADAEQQSVQPVPIELRPVLERAVRAYSAISELHPISVEVADGLPSVLADDTALDQMLGQLFENAVKYSPGGGPVELYAEVRGCRVVLSVSDRGVGLPPGAETVVFDRFHQAHGGDRRAFGGVGLGLHIVKSLAESIGATASAHRRDGGGTRIELALAIAPPAPRRELGATPGELGATPGEHRRDTAPRTS
jgi:signal transduction histidine kinase